MALDWHDLLFRSIFCIGLIALVKRFLNLITWLHSAFIKPPKDLTSYGSWAVVTGCTDGIGKALTFELADKGLNLVLVGRSGSKLEATTAEIRHRCRGADGNGVEIRSVLVDLAETSGEEIERRIKKGIDGLDVGVLINNAGMGYPYARFFHEVDLKLMESIMRVNADAATWVTRAVLPGMLTKAKGAIVNIGSGSAACLPSYPLYTVYSATKAYLGMFSRSLSLEYQKRGIDIQCQVPLLVATKLASIRKTSVLIPGPKEYSRASLRWVGKDHTCTPYWSHYLQWCVIWALPESLMNRLTFRYFVGMRARGLRKDARLQAAAVPLHGEPTILRR